MVNPDFTCWYVFQYAWIKNNNKIMLVIPTRAATTINNRPISPVNILPTIFKSLNKKNWVNSQLKKGIHLIQVFYIKLPTYSNFSSLRIYDINLLLVLYFPVKHIYYPFRHVTHVWFVGYHNQSYILLLMQITEEFEYHISGFRV